VRALGAVLLLTGCWGSSAVCENQAELVAHQIFTTAQANGAGCRTDSDCVLVPAGVRCVSDCEQAVLVGRESDFASALSTLESTCPMGCGVASDCANQVATCKAGVCRALPAP
jgi:hypothetical protein